MSGETQNGILDAETVEDHDGPEEEDGIHCPVFQVPVFLDIVNIPYGEFPHHKGTDTVPDEDQRELPS